MTNWAKPENGRGVVDRAGRRLAQGPGGGANVDEWFEAFEIVGNWRSSHGYALQTVKMLLLGRAQRVDESAIVAQRLKRIPSIRFKLQRNPNMGLTQMQDIGGCRAIMRGTKRLKDLVEVFEEADAKNPKRGSKFVKKYDYVAAPKKDGYRSVHFVYKYRSDSAHLTCYNDLRIEIQLRTRLQHAWATAVETAGTFIGQALKSNVGDEEWKRFFALMGTAIARRERLPIVPNTPDDAKTLAKELDHLEKKLQVIMVLGGWGNVLQQTSVTGADDTGYLLVLDPKQLTLKITSYTRENWRQATREYDEIEKSTAGTETQAVLVTTTSLANLRRAYPNYYLDTTTFVQEIGRAIAGKD